VEGRGEGAGDEGRKEKGRRREGRGEARPPDTEA